MSPYPARAVGALACCVLIVLGAGCRGPCPWECSPRATEEHGPPPGTAKLPPCEEAPACAARPAPAPAPQRVVIEVIQKQAPAPAPAPAMLPAPAQATPVAAAPAPIAAPVMMQAAPAGPAALMPQAVQVVQAGGAVAGPAAQRFRVALVLDWFRLPVPWLRPVAVPAAAVEYPEPQTVLLVQAPALPPCGAAPAMMPAPMPAAWPAMVPAPMPAMVPACAARAGAAPAALDAQRCADLQRAVEALAREMDRPNREK